MRAAQAPLRTIINPRALDDKVQSKTAARLNYDLSFINYLPHPFRPLSSLSGLCGNDGVYMDVINAAVLGPLRTRCHFAARRWWWWSTARPRRHRPLLPTVTGKSATRRSR